jgi:phosphoribosylanthranilate isomerase
VEYVFGVVVTHQSPFIKMCGFTREADVLFSRALAVDYYGFVFYEPSPRYIAPERAAALTQLLSPHTASQSASQSASHPVGLFVNHSAAQVLAAVQASGVRVLQFHGNESPGFCEQLSQQLGMPYWKAVHVSSDAHSDDLLKLCSTYSTAQALLFDTASPAWGGTGHTFEWQKLAPLAQLHASKSVPPLVLSGGLSVQNVAQGITLLSPWAVDISSGIEVVDANGNMFKGAKDPAKMAAFVAAVRQT